MIGILDYRMGNLGSVVNACKFLDLDARLVRSPDELEGIHAILFPGQGAFADCMGHLQEYGYVPVLRDWIAADRPFLGICMGLQLLFESSEESPGTEGLGILPGQIKRFPQSDLKVPQMGWNRVQQSPGADNPLFDGIEDGSHFYFVHSYYAPLAGQDWVAATTDYGREYVTGIRRGRLFAVQFHPEKSQRDGIRMLKNFSETARY